MRATLSALVAFFVLASPASAVSPDVVISQVYGGGGNAGATLTHDFIELYNRGSAPIDVTSWSVQYASSTGTTWQSTALSGALQPGARYLVQQAAGRGRRSRYRYRTPPAASAWAAPAARWRS